MHKLVSSSNITKAILFTIGSLLVVWVAFYNGYPLVYSDTGTYLYSSVHLTSPDDRPIFYGLFLRLTGMQANNWVPIIFQGIIGYWVIYRFVKLTLNKFSIFWTFGIVVALALLTALPWYASQLMPDIFTAYGILLVYLLFYDASQKWITALYLILLFLCTSSHLSNVLILGASFGVLSMVKFKDLFKPKSELRLKWILGGLLILLVFPLQAYLNYLEKGEFVVTRASNIFFVAKGLESNLYKTYVRENKGKIDVPFEKETEKFEDNPGWFLWSNESPVNNSGLPREEINRLYEPVVKDLMSQWRYRKMFMAEALRAGKEQLKFHRVGSGLVPYTEGSAPQTMMFHEFKNQLKAYESSIQYKEGLESNYHLTISKNIFNITLVILLLALLYRPTRRKLGLIILFILISAIFNAVVTGGIANVYDRLQVRVNWLYVLLALLSIIVAVQELFNKMSTKGTYNETKH